MTFRNRQILSFLTLLILISYAIVSPGYADPDTRYVVAYEAPFQNDVAVIAIGDEEREKPLNYQVFRTDSFGTENVLVTIISDEPINTGNGQESKPELLNPGETRFFSDTIEENQTKQYIRVTYNKPAPVSLQILTPDGEYGTFSDIDDGIEDNAIFMRIYSETGLDPGRWYYQVHLPDNGDPVSFQIESWDE